MIYNFRNALIALPLAFKSALDRLPPSRPSPPCHPPSLTPSLTHFVRSAPLPFCPSSFPARAFPLSSSFAPRTNKTSEDCPSFFPSLLLPGLRFSSLSLSVPPPFRHALFIPSSFVCLYSLPHSSSSSVRSDGLVVNAGGMAAAFAPRPTDRVHVQSLSLSATPLFHPLSQIRARRRGGGF